MSVYDYGSFDRSTKTFLWDGRADCLSASNTIPKRKVLKEKAEKFKRRTVARYD